MEANTAEILFLVMFGVSISFSSNNVIMGIFPLGVGHLLNNGVKAFILRALFVGLTATLWAVCLVISLKFCKTIRSNGLIYDVLTVLILLLLSASSWLCDHIARIIFFPFRKTITLREKKYSSVDILFVLIYFIAAGLLILIRNLFQ